MKTPLVWAIIGPNGAGKSTYYAFEVQPRLALEFVNADEIARVRWSDDPTDRSYDAARLAEARRQQLVLSRTSFVFETVFSHPSKPAFLADAKRAGYTVIVTFVGVGSPELSVERVRDRVARAGHPVPEEKIRARFARLQAPARAAVLAADHAYVVDNSSAAQPLRRILKFDRGLLIAQSPPVPAWVATLFAVELAK